MRFVQEVTSQNPLCKPLRLLSKFIIHGLLFINLSSKRYDSKSENFDQSTCTKPYVGTATAIRDSLTLISQQIL